MITLHYAKTWAVRIVSAGLLLIGLLLLLILIIIIITIIELLLFEQCQFKDWEAESLKQLCFYTHITWDVRNENPYFGAGKESFLD